MQPIRLEFPPLAPAASHGILPVRSLVDWTNPLTQGLVDLWPGASLVSAVRPGQAFTNTNGATVENKCGPIWRQNNQQIVLYGDSSPENFSRTDRFTVSVVAGWAALGTWAVVLNRSSGTGNNSGWYVYRDTTNYIRIDMVGTTNSNDHIVGRFVPFVPFSVGAVYRFVFTYDGSVTGSGFSCWCNGVKLTNIPFGSLTTETTCNNYLRVGYRDIDGMANNGWVRDIAIWRRQLTPAEVQSFFANPGQLVVRPAQPFMDLPPDALLYGSALYPCFPFGRGDGYATISPGLG